MKNYGITIRAELLFSVEAKDEEEAQEAALKVMRSEIKKTDLDLNDWALDETIMCDDCGNELTDCECDDDQAEERET